MGSMVLAILIGLSSIFCAADRAYAQASLIRDAEIEGLLRSYAVPLFRAAKLNPSSVKVYIINSDTLNAFVANGQRIFVHTGLLTKTENPNELIGVLAHETAHIAGGHLVALGSAMDRAGTQAIISMLLGAAVVFGGAAAGSADIAQAGSSVLAGGSYAAQRNLLSYMRAQESAADQAAVKYLQMTGKSPKGMLSLFERMANQSLASAQYQDPYARSHPMGFARLRTLETRAGKSPYFNRPDSPAMLLRHKLMQAKLAGFLSPRQVYHRYPKSDRSLPAHYARAIASFQSGDILNSLREIKVLTSKQPANPYFWELKGQALLNSGKPRQAIVPLERAVRLAPNSGLIRMLLAQSLLAIGDKKLAEKAIKHLRHAKLTENRSPQLHLEFAKAYAMLDKIPLADLETAEAATKAGDLKLAKLKAKQARSKLKRGTTAWRRADDILNLETPKK